MYDSTRGQGRQHEDPRRRSCSLLSQISVRSSRISQRSGRTRELRRELAHRESLGTVAALDVYPVAGAKRLRETRYERGSDEFENGLQERALENVAEEGRSLCLNVLAEEASELSRVGVDAGLEESCQQRRRPRWKSRTHVEGSSRKVTYLDTSERVDRSSVASDSAGVRCKKRRFVSAGARVDKRHPATHGKRGTAVQRLRGCPASSRGLTQLACTSS